MKRTEEFIGGSLQGYIELVPSKLVEILGRPSDGDDYKTSGEYGLELDDGTKFYIYDWKSTNLYDDGYPLVSDLWTSDKPFEFHIGGKSGIDVAKITDELNKLLDK